MMMFFVLRPMSNVRLIYRIFCRLLRGNHETEPCNSDERYEDGSFLTQCNVAIKDPEKSARLFQAINRAFDCMPVAAVISEQLFCCHGGIPHSDTYAGSNTIDTLNLLPRGKDPFGKRITSENIQEALSSWSDEDWRGARWSGCDPHHVIIRQDQQPTAHSRQRVLKAAFQVMWADPYSTDADFPESGFFSKGVSDPTFKGPVPSPPPRVLYYTLKAAHIFFKNHGLNRIIRGHQGKRTGVHIQLSASVMTIFSDSCDHFKSKSDGLPSMTLCGCVIVDRDAIRCILCQPIVGLTS